MSVQTRHYRCDRCQGRLEVPGRPLGLNSAGRLVLEWPIAMCCGTEMGREVDEHGQRIGISGPYGAPHAVDDRGTAAVRLASPPGWANELPRIVATREDADRAGVPLGVIGRNSAELGPAWPTALPCDGRDFNPALFPDLERLLIRLGYMSGRTPDFRISAHNHIGVASFNMRANDLELVREREGTDSPTTTEGPA